MRSRKSILLKITCVGSNPVSIKAVSYNSIKKWKVSFNKRKFSLTIISGTTSNAYYTDRYGKMNGVEDIFFDHEGSKTS